MSGKCRLRKWSLHRVRMPGSLDATVVVRVAAPMQIKRGRQREMLSKQINMTFLRNIEALVNKARENGGRLPEEPNEKPPEQPTG